LAAVYNDLSYDSQNISYDSQSISYDSQIISDILAFICFAEYSSYHLIVIWTKTGSVILSTNDGLSEHIDTGIDDDYGDNGNF
jgi:hypothetical protein